MAEATGKKRNKSKNGNKTHGRNLVKCAAYRAKVGKPRGPGKPGNKSGKNKTPKLKIV